MSNLLKFQLPTFLVFTLSMLIGSKVSATSESVAPKSLSINSEATSAVSSIPSDRKSPQELTDRLSYLEPIPEVISEIVPESISEVVPKFTPEVVPEFIPEVVPEVISEALPRFTPEAISQRSLERSDAIAQAVSPDSSGSVGDSFSPEQLRQDLLIEPVPTRRRAGAAPSSTLSTPTAFGANFGTAFVGLSLVDRPRGGDDPDGSAVVGIGLGDSRRYVGLEVATSIISLSDSNGRDSIGGSGAVNLKLHRILPGGVGVAIGLENALAWGDARQADSSVYGVVSRAFPLQPNNPNNRMPLVLSLGAGGGRFRSVSDIQDRRNSIGVFASAGLRVIPQASLIANWTGQDLNLGASVAPFSKIPLTITAGLADVTGNAGDGVRFAIGIGYGIRF
jgi:hypothetical protein